MILKLHHLFLGVSREFSLFHPAFHYILIILGSSFAAPHADYTLFSLFYTTIIYLPSKCFQCMFLYNRISLVVTILFPSIYKSKIYKRVYNHTLYSLFWIYYFFRIVINCICSILFICVYHQINVKCWIDCNE